MSENYVGEQAKRIMSEATTLKELAARNKSKKWNRNEASYHIQHQKEQMSKNKTKNGEGMCVHNTE